MIMVLFSCKNRINEDLRAFFVRYSQKCPFIMQKTRKTAEMWSTFGAHVVFTDSTCGVVVDHTEGRTYAKTAETIILPVF